MKTMFAMLTLLAAFAACVSPPEALADRHAVAAPASAASPSWYASSMAYTYDPEDVLAGLQELEDEAHAAYNADTGMLRKCLGNPATTGHLMYASVYGHRCPGRGVRMFRTTPLEESQEAWAEVLNELLRGSPRVRFDADIREHMLLIAGVANDRAGNASADFTGIPFHDAPVEWGSPAVAGKVVAIIGIDADVERDSDGEREIVPVLDLTPL